MRLLTQINALFLVVGALWLIATGQAWQFLPIAIAIWVLVIVDRIPKEKK
jgi:hypothetical protein